MRTTIRDIAKRVGVSNSLVSLYLNNRPLAARIAESTKRKIDEREEQNSRPCDGETLQRLRQLLRPDPSGRMFPAGLPAADRHHALQCGRGTAGAGEPDLAAGGRDLLYAETVSGGLSERHRKERLSGSAAELGDGKSANWGAGGFWYPISRGRTFWKRSWRGTESRLSADGAGPRRMRKISSF